MAISLSNLLARVKHYRTDLHGGEHMFALQTSARRLATLVPLKIATVELDTVIGQNVYDIDISGLPGNDDELLAEEPCQVASVHRADGSPLRKINTQEPGAIRRFNILNTGLTSRWGDRFGVLVLDPTPDAVETLTVEVYTCPMITAETVDMPHHATEAIVTGAVYELMLIPGAGFSRDLVSLWAHRWTKEFGNYAGSVAFGTAGNGQMHIDSQYQARTRAGSYGVGGWMPG